MDVDPGRRALMAAQAGDRAQKSQVFHCATCGQTVPVQAGEVIPPCPNGHTEYKRRMQQRGRGRDPNR